MCLVAFSVVASIYAKWLVVPSIIGQSDYGVHILLKVLSRGR